MAGKTLVSDMAMPIKAVHWVGLGALICREERPDHRVAGGWPRIMQATPGYRETEHLHAAGDYFRVGMESLEFALKQAAATAVPVVVVSSAQPREQSGRITSVLRDADVLCVRGPSLNLRLCSGDIASIRVHHRSAVGSNSRLEIVGHQNQRIALFKSERDYGLAWHVLVGWLLLREAEARVG